MTDYTPTTEDIKRSYLLQSIADPYAQAPFIPIVDQWFDRWLAEELRKAKHEAWSEGYGSGYADCHLKRGTVDEEASPYWKGETE